MSDAQHMAFTRQFGELEFNPAALIAKQYGVETQTARPAPRNSAGNLGHLEHRRERQGDRRARRRRGVLAHRQLVCRRAAGGELVALAGIPAAERRRHATYFLNMYSAYETLPAETKQRIDGMTMIHAATHSSGGKAHKGFESVSRCVQGAGRASADGPHPSGNRAQGLVSRAGGSTPMCSACRSRTARRCSTSCGRTRPRRNSPGARIGGSAI